MSIEFTISLDKKEIKMLINTILKTKDPSSALDRLGQKLEFIYENMIRDEELNNDE